MKYLFCVLLMALGMSLAAQSSLSRLTHYDQLTTDTLSDAGTTTVTDSRYVTRDYSLSWLLEANHTVE